MRQDGYLRFEWSGESSMWRCWYLYQISRKTPPQLFSLCTRCWRLCRLCTVRNEMNSTTIKKKTEVDIEESFFLLSKTISSSRIWNWSRTFQTSLSRKGDLCNWSPSREKLEEYTESILRLCLVYDRVISSAKRVHICWVTYLHVSTADLPHSSVCFRVKQPKLVKTWSPSMQVRNTD